MLPKWHILFAFLFAYILYWFTSMTIIDASLIFLSSVLIDFDHYFWYGFKKKDWSLKNSYIYLKKHRDIYKPLMLFHTIEFHIFIGLLIFFFQGFLYILIGMMFHSVLDITDMAYRNKLGLREFSLVRYLILKNKKKDSIFNIEIYLS
ncbi:MAG: hypothetical protein PHH54_05700 [Candidatus Nanoarchaeia archaeon]|nr:hypothetical protein [Candidatus Nanoarchaeia archaeon]MDD5741453.1 hypothetical protein [Candidatus Nanoarchaeia archaeon]